MTIQIRGHEVAVNVKAEIESFEWRKARIRGESFVACSPFRDERRPSFSLSLESGLWIDFGADSEEWSKGNLIKLLAFLRGETYEETEQYLLELYAPNCAPNINLDNLKLNLNLQFSPEPCRYLDPAILKKFAFRHPYLAKRGITEKAQRAAQIGYDREHRAITIPWFDYLGRLVNIKFRKVDSKLFWYLGDGQPIRDHLYMLNWVHKLQSTEVYIVEAEIDALTLWGAGRPSVALGRAHMSKRQRDLLLQSPAKRLIIATDNDKAGRRAKESIINQLGGFMELLELIFPEGRKDVNEFSESEIEKLTSIPYGFTLPLF